MKKFLFATLVLFSLWSCDNQVVQYPVSYNNDDFMQRSQERGKILLQEEVSWFNDYRAKSDLKFNKTESGIWITNAGVKTNTTAKVGDYINFTYQVYDLDNNIIYNYNEIGEQKVILGKADIIRGLHSSLQLIEEGTQARVLLPSFLSYGGMGDDAKIGPNQPLILDIKVNTIKKN
ncbi:FKBP-type peptidyl-prolyl cis-trans isomerase [Faecalibacter sp. LW9]|uniref:FKBP-type peptidyl-prolyl cis-trans isomerase n=1 Tax=Faecalibacter sp. LW9 TaxID=3103144 RepID=UPI002B002849|nr:FKBP-type peptidyl-prolyl cis-trans isomerase [Faecalibacter sp. LW9]